MILMILYSESLACDRDLVDQDLSCFVDYVMLDLALIEASRSLTLDSLHDFCSQKPSFLCIRIVYSNHQVSF